jgi:hypothetical protein
LIFGEGAPSARDLARQPQTTAATEA